MDVWLKFASADTWWVSVNVNGIGDGTDGLVQTAEAVGSTVHSRLQ
jgi:hypothetical protein